MERGDHTVSYHVVVLIDCALDTFRNIHLERSRKFASSQCFFINFFNSITYIRLQFFQCARYTFIQAWFLIPPKIKIPIRECNSHNNQLSEVTSTKKDPKIPHNTTPVLLDCAVASDAFRSGLMRPKMFQVCFGCYWYYIYCTRCFC